MTSQEMGDYFFKNSIKKKKRFCKSLDTLPLRGRRVSVSCPEPGLVSLTCL